MTLSNAYLERLLKDPKTISKISFDELSEILNAMKILLDKEFLLVELTQSDQEKEVIIVGDLHGNLESLQKILDHIKDRKPEFIVFLGDIVDRGRFQLECLVLICCLKIIDPNRYYILRGNHEEGDVNKRYGFYDVFVRKFKDSKKFEEIENLYNSLPACLVLNDDILCLHGGIPSNIQALEKLKNTRLSDLIGKELIEYNQILYEIFWNDPKNHIEGFKPSYRGEGIKFFGRDAFDKFLNYNHLNRLVRSHECFTEGYKWYFHRRLLSIFSSFDYSGAQIPNPASIAWLKDGELGVKIFYGS
ncbi:MAG: metallophosphoesterase [Candidatus Lokiarchaeota archaeon]|nr:metallophosphoesterase [Candidatus Lokiarchaeota archaeon]